MTTILPVPALFADFTTEGGINQYIFNSSKFGGASAWVAAIGGMSSRSSSASRINASGLIESVANDVLRFDFDPLTLASRGILLEAASTNLILQSNTFSDAAWTQIACSLGAATTSPDGTANAVKIQEDNTNNIHVIIQGVTVALGSSVTMSAYFKPAERTQAIIRVNDGGTTASCVFTLSGSGSSSILENALSISGAIFPASNGFYRCSITYSPSGTTPTAEFGPTIGSVTYAGTTGSGVFGYGAQVEQLGFASSYIATTSGTVARSADIFTATPVSSWYNATVGTLFAQSDTQDGVTNNANIVAIHNTIANFIALSNSVSGANVLGDVFSGSSAQFQSLANSPSQSGYVVNTLRRAAISALAANFLYVADGGTQVAGATGIMPVGPTTLSLTAGALAQSNSQHITQIGYWPQTFTVSQLRDLTSGNATFNFAYGPLVTTDLTRVPARAFTRKNYRDLMREIFAEGEAAKAANEAREAAKAKQERDARIEYERQINERKENKRRAYFEREMRGSGRVSAAIAGRAGSDRSSANNLNDRLRHLDIVSGAFRK